AGEDGRAGRRLGRAARVLPRAELVRSHVRPGMPLHLSPAPIRANALVYALVRQVRGREPGFAAVALGLTGAWIALVHAGLARRVVTSFCGESYPSPAPSPLVDAAWRAGRGEIQNWSILTLPPPLLAAALGLPVPPTPSLR